MEKESGEVIQSLWIGKRLPLMQQLSIRSFLAQGYAYHLYVYGKVRNIPSGVRVLDAGGILPPRSIFTYNISGPGRGSYTGFANWFRYKLLLEKGGTWADLDILCLKPFGRGDYLVASETASTGKIVATNCFMKVPAGCEFIRACCERAASVGPNCTRWGQTGPALVDSLIEEFGLRSAVLPTTVICPIAAKDWKQLLAPGLNYRIPEETAAIHLWHMMWKCENKKRSRIRKWREGLFGGKAFDEDALYPEATLYGRLQRMVL